MKPFVKWAGGKTQLLDDIKKVVPSSYSRYYEPFLGGGAVLLYLMPKTATVSDANPHLINAYLSIKDNVHDLMQIIDDIDCGQNCSAELYYSVRDKYNEHIKNNVNDISTAAYFLWLNHHCFNGLYRTNKFGEFNTPWNRTVGFRASYDKTNLLEISAYLQSADISIICSDYKDVMTQARSGDFIFLDPPYDPVGEYGDFKRYTKNQFYEKDQTELCELIKQAHGNNISFCLTNSNTELIRSLYRDFNITVIKTHRNINSHGGKRFGEDAIITA